MGRKYEMPDRARHERRILRLSALWAQRMDIDHVDISHVFADALRGEEVAELEMTAAITNAEWQYRKATITWYLPAVATMSDEGLEAVVIHELVHVLLGPIKEAMKANTDKVEELATENVARAILKAWSD